MPTSTTEGLPAPKLLLVDDVPANLVALEAVFAPLGCELVRASSGEEALRALLRDDFAAILLDVQMPGLDGFQTAKLIRLRDRTRHIPIVFLTAVSKEREYIFRGYEHGAVDYLVKPFNPDILRAKISVLVELYQRREQVKFQAEELLRHELAAHERESATRYQGLVDSMPQIVWVTGANGAIELVNRVLCQYTGLDPLEALKNGWMDAIHPDDSVGSLERWHSARTSAQSYESEVRIRRADGEYRWFLARAVPQRDAQGTIERWVGTATDIDDQRRTLEELSAAVQAKDDFLAAASHELRTPLAAAKAQVQLTTRRLGPAHADEATVRSLKTVGSQIDRMTRLVEDLLDVSRLQTGRLSLQLTEYDLCEMIRAEVERIQALSPSHELKVDIPDTIAVVADRDRIDQVVINLLTNAVRYSPAGGAIMVSARPLNDLVQVTVVDRGVGIPEEKQGAIFERFGRAHGARYGGLGLGLTIAQGIIEQHGGRIWVESSGCDGEGTTFRFEIPARARPRPSVG